jgi:fumarate hydratase class II
MQRHDDDGSTQLRTSTPAEPLYGPQTARAVANFDVGEDAMPIGLIRAYGVIKQAAALVNAELGELDPELAARIARAAERLGAGELDGHFPLRVWQSGSGTQTHMNVNEVLASVANAQAGHIATVHPNDHVNRGQSTNDTFPTALHIAAVEGVQLALLPALDALLDTLQHKAQLYGSVVKIGRTHLQDAVPLTLGQEISGWAAQLSAARAAIARCLPELHALALGGTAVGTGLNSHPKFAALAIERIATLSGRPFVPAANRFAALAGHDACVALSGALRQLATACMKVANDVRWLGSGPRCGLGELHLPENEPGSSIMPGKVNPTQCEMLAMVCCQVMGNDVALGLAASQGSLELNAYKPLIAHSLLGSIRLLADACRSFDRRCAAGLEPRLGNIQAHLERSLMLVTVLAPQIGYEAAARIAQHADSHDTTLRQAALELGLVSAEDFDRIVDPLAMTEPSAG